MSWYFTTLLVLSEYGNLDIYEPKKSTTQTKSQKNAEKKKQNMTSWKNEFINDGIPGLLMEFFCIWPCWGQKAKVDKNTDVTNVHEDLIFFIMESFQIFCQKCFKFLLILLYIFFVSPAHNMGEEKPSYEFFLGSLVINLTDSLRTDHLFLWQT